MVSPSTREILEHIVKQIENYVANWNKGGDSYRDFKILEDIYIDLCGLLDMEPKDLDEIMD